MKLPALIDPHVHFRTPGAEHKEDWRSGARAALAGGITTVLDMPNNTPPATTASALLAKRALILSQLTEIPLRFGLYQGATADFVPASKACALKVFMGSSTGTLLLEDPTDAFRIAAEHDMLVAIHGEKEALIRERSKSFSTHSTIRSPEVAAAAINEALALVERFGTRLYILHVSSRLELDLIRAAKARGLPVYAEATPHHLFFDTTCPLGNLIKVNPPVRSPQDRAALWEALIDGTIDTIGSDHAPHTLAEKRGDNAPAGIPGIELSLPLLFTAHLQGKLTLERLLDLMRYNIQAIFDLPDNDDTIELSLDERTVTDEQLHTRCGWSPYRGRRLCGWPIRVTLNNRTYDVRHLQELSSQPH